MCASASLAAWPQLGCSSRHMECPLCHLPVNQPSHNQQRTQVKTAHIGQRNAQGWYQRAAVVRTVRRTALHHGPVAGGAYPSCLQSSKQHKRGRAVGGAAIREQHCTSGTSPRGKSTGCCIDSQVNGATAGCARRARDHERGGVVSRFHIDCLVRLLFSISGRVSKGPKRLSSCAPRCPLSHAR
jgi:hypothetical protein